MKSNTTTTYPTVPAGLVETCVLNFGVSFEIPKSETFAMK
jgi:hypothetical protein